MINIKQKILNILDKYDIEYRLRGKNVAKNHIALCCPWCVDDNGFHLGIDYTNNQYACWKSSTHSGKNIVWLLMKVLHLSKDEVIDLLDLNSNADELDFLQTIEKLFQEEKKEETIIKRVSSLEMPEEFREIQNSGSTKVFYDYLESRGFNFVEVLIKVVGLKCCLINEQAMRIIFPIYYQNKLVSWQGRSIYKNAKLRYLDLSPEKSIRSIKDCLFFYDYLKDIKKYQEKEKIYQDSYLFITEGVFDALKIIWYGGSNIYSTCLFTLSISDEQVRLINSIKNNFKKIFLILDKGVEIQVFNVLDKLSFIHNLEVVSLPLEFNDKDCGALNEKQIITFCKKCIGESGL